MKTEETEWNELLRAYGILSPIQTEETSEDSDEIKNIDEIHESENSEWEDLQDDRIVQAYMQRRREEMKAYFNKAKYGELLPIQRSEWTIEVTEASRKEPVMVFLYKDA
ncbi:hypothetical protein PCK2_000336 [Pneumocystis canis]|nr:hypothetical protein PCK2_000336 [Pneumocystis canis]